MLIQQLNFKLRIGVNGYLRLATESDHSLLLQWVAAFYSEIGMVNEEIEPMVDVQLKRQSLYLWDDGIPVSMVGGREFSPNGCSDCSGLHTARISPQRICNCLCRRIKPETFRSGMRSLLSVYRFSQSHI
jgi:hypothetical protein